MLGGMLVLGAPAKVIRLHDKTEKAKLRKSAEEYSVLSKAYS